MEGPASSGPRSHAPPSLATLPAISMTAGTRSRSSHAPSGLMRTGRNDSGDALRHRLSHSGRLVVYEGRLHAGRRGRQGPAPSSHNHPAPELGPCSPRVAPLHGPSGSRATTSRAAEPRDELLSRRCERRTRGSLSRLADSRGSAIRCRPNSTGTSVTTPKPNGDESIQLLTEHYERLEPEARATIPPKAGFHSD